MNTAILFGSVLTAFVALGLIQMAFARRRATAEEKVLKGYFLLGLSGLMAKLAMADGKVTDDEVGLAHGYFKTMQLADAERALCVGNFVNARRDGLTARDHANRFVAYANPVASEFLYSLLWRLSAADGVLDPGEDRLLADIALYLGLGRPVYERFKAGDRPTYDRKTLCACGVPPSLLPLA